MDCSIFLEADFGNPGSPSEEAQGFPVAPLFGACQAEPPAPAAPLASGRRRAGARMAARSGQSYLSAKGVQARQAGGSEGQSACGARSDNSHLTAKRAGSRAPGACAGGGPSTHLLRGHADHGCLRAGRKGKCCAGGPSVVPLGRAPGQPRMATLHGRQARS